LTNAADIYKNKNLVFSVPLMPDYLW